MCECCTAPLTYAELYNSLWMCMATKDEKFDINTWVARILRKSKVSCFRYKRNTIINLNKAIMTQNIFNKLQKTMKSAVSNEHYRVKKWENETATRLQLKCGTYLYRPNGPIFKKQKHEYFKSHHSSSIKPPNNSSSSSPSPVVST